MTDPESMVAFLEDFFQQPAMPMLEPAAQLQQPMTTAGVATGLTSTPATAAEMPTANLPRKRLRIRNRHPRIEAEVVPSSAPQSAAASTEHATRCSTAGLSKERAKVVIEMVLEHMMHDKSAVLNVASAANSEAYKTAVEVWKHMLMHEICMSVLRELQKRNMFPVTVSALACMLYDATAAYRK